MISKIYIQYSLFAIICFSGLPARAAPRALIVSVQGAVQVLHPLSSSDTSTANQALFEGNKYRAETAKVGLKVSGKDVVMSSSDSKAKIIFEHGDVFIVSSGSALVIPETDKESPRTATIIYGKLRAVIDKDGPLSGLRIKTPTAVAGVRGTDLFVSYDPADSKTEVKVLRGEVEVSPQAAPKAQAPVAASPSGASGLPPKNVTAAAESVPVAQPIQVKAGQIGTVSLSSATTVDSSAQKPALETSLNNFTSKDLKQVNQESKIVNSDLSVKEETKVEVKKAEEKAVEVVIQDVKRYDPSEAQKLAQNNFKSVEEINQVATENVVIEKKDEVIKTAKVDAKYSVFVQLIGSQVDGSSFNTPNAYSNMSPGFGIGGFWRKPLSETWKFKLGLGFTQTSASINVPIPGFPTFSSLIVGNYLVVPADFEYSFGNRFSMVAGLIPIVRINTYVASASGGSSSGPNNDLPATVGAYLAGGYNVGSWGFYLGVEPKVVTQAANPNGPQFSSSSVILSTEYSFF